MAALDTPLGGLLSSRQYNVVPSSFSSIQTQCPFWSYNFRPRGRRTPVASSYVGDFQRLSRAMGTAAIWSHEQGGWIQIIPRSRSRIHTHVHARTHTRDRDETKEWKDKGSFGGRRRRRTQYLRPSVCPALRRIRRQSYSATLLLHDPCLLAHHNNVFIK